MFKKRKNKKTFNKGGGLVGSRVREGGEKQSNKQRSQLNVMMPRGGVEEVWKKRASKDPLLAHLTLVGGWFPREPKEKNSRNGGKRLDYEKHEFMSREQNLL